VLLSDPGDCGFMIRRAAACRQLSWSSVPRFAQETLNSTTGGGSRAAAIAGGLSEAVERAGAEAGAGKHGRPPGSRQLGWGSRIRRGDRRQEGIRWRGLDGGVTGGFDEPYSIARRRGE